MLKRYRSSVCDFNFHLVLVTKYRKPIFTTKVLQNDLKQILKQIAKKREIEIQALEVMPDHVHMLISFKPKYAPSDIVKSFKGYGARVWFQTHPETKKKLYGGHLWSPSYFMSTTGNVSKQIVQHYIESQMKHSIYNNAQTFR